MYRTTKKPIKIAYDKSKMPVLITRSTSSHKLRNKADRRVGNMY